MPSYVMSLDQGTSSSRTLIFDDQAQVVSSVNIEFPTYYPQPGWVEQDPEELWDSQYQSMLQALEQANLSFEQISAIGITNQRETVVAWDKETGKPVGRAIVWQCRRTAERCDALAKAGHKSMIHYKTGLLLDAYFSATKMQWILENDPQAQELAQQQRLAFGTIDSWLVWKLTQGQEHLTDASNASRTLLYHLFEDQWDPELLAMFDIPADTLPRIVDSCGLLAQASADITQCSIPITGIAGDQQASLFGQACFDPGMAKNTYGTGCFLLSNTGDKPILSEHGLLSTVAWRIEGKPCYALEGSVFVAGALIQWLRDQLGIIQEASETDALAQSLDSNEGVYVVPAFVGLGAPHWDAYARGTILGLTRDSGKAHIARASLESMAYQVLDVLKIMETEIKHPLRELRVDGGAAHNEFLCQFQTDLLQIPVIRPQTLETTALGAAMLAGLGIGIWEDMSTLKGIWQAATCFNPQMPHERIQLYLRQWHEALSRSKAWTQP